MTDVILDNCIESTIDSSYQLNRTKLEKSLPILAQFLDLKNERIIECLHAILRKIVALEHPSGCFQEILSCLYDNFTLTKEAIFQWRDNNDPLEQEGKGECLKVFQNYEEF